MAFQIILHRLFFVFAIVLSLMLTNFGWHADGIAQAQATGPQISGSYTHIGTVHNAVTGTFVAGLGICEVDGAGNGTCDPFTFTRGGGGGVGSISIVFTPDSAGTGSTGTFAETLNLPDGTTATSNSRYVVTQVNESNVAVQIFAVQDEPAGPDGAGLLTSIFELIPAAA